MIDLENHLEISIHEEHTMCADKCCSYFDTVIIINDEKVYPESDSREDVLKAILEHLGYKPEITWML